MKRSLVFCLFLLILPCSLPAIVVQVELVNDHSEFAHTAERRADALLNACSRYRELGKPVESVRDHFTAEAFTNFKNLVIVSGLYPVLSRYQTRLIETQDGYFEIRDLRVHVRMGETSGMPYQMLVIGLDRSGTVVDVHFSLEKHHIQAIVQEGTEIDDLAFREKIKHFIELYRTAYNAKDLEFIERTLSDDALIIISRVVKSRPQSDDYLERSTLSDQQIEYIRKSKTEYLASLTAVFRNNDFIRLGFDHVEIQRHPRINEIYGVRLKQRWNSSTYSDEGYLFLMMDFQNPAEPIIHVRAWQEQPFSNGATVNLFDFEIID